MSNFKFKRVKNKFRWESRFMALEFSNPSIQGFDDFIKLEEESQILYYYYKVKIYKKIDTWDKNDNEIVRWELVSERRTHDFPSIIDLKYILNLILTDDIRVDGQKHIYQNGAVSFSKTFSTEGFACDDFYEITRYVYDAKNREDKYIVYCGNTYDFQGDLNSSGIRTPYVYEKDIKALKKCVEEFIKYSIKIHNKVVETYKKSLEIKNGKIYQYVKDGYNINKNKVEAIYAVGDNVSIIRVSDNIETDIDDVIISNITEDTVVVDEDIEINISDIAYMNIEQTKERYYYKEEDIAKDFFNILSEEEVIEFKENSIHKLFKKYRLAIIDRTSMCRSEHDFNIDYNAGDTMEQLTPILLDIIFMIKKLISES